MSWNDDMGLTVRAMVFDLDTPQRYTDDRIEQLIVVAARLVMGEVDFLQPYVISVSNVTISPDPTDPTILDNNFINLVSAKTACIMDNGAAILAADQALKVKDGQSEVDLRDTFKAKLAIIKNGWCVNYQAIKIAYVTGQQGEGIGAAICGPFRLFAGAQDRAYLTQGDPRYTH